MDQDAADQFRAGADTLVQATRLVEVLNNPKAAASVERASRAFVDLTIGYVAKLEHENGELRAKLELLEGGAEHQAVPMV